MTNKQKSKKFQYLKKGEGKLASNNHGITEFSKKRKQKIVKEQEEREEKYKKDNKL